MRVIKSPSLPAPVTLEVGGESTKFQLFEQSPEPEEMLEFLSESYVREQRRGTTSYPLVSESVWMRLTMR